MSILTVSLLLLLYGTTFSSSQYFSGDHIEVFPPSKTTFLTDTSEFINCNFSEKLKSYILQTNSSKFYLGLRYDPTDEVFRRMIKVKTYTRDHRHYQLDIPVTIAIKPEMLQSSQHTNKTIINRFKLDINNIGHTNFSILILELKMDNITSALVSKTYKLTVIRKHRTVDVGFNAAITTLMIVNAFALGCLTEIQIIKTQLKERLKLAMSIITQYIAVPLITFGLTRALKIENELALGFLFTACVPGGGLGHLIVAITKEADLELSIILNMFDLLIPLGVVPIIMYSFCQLLPNNAGEIVNNIYYLVLWVLLLIVPYSVGILVRHRKESASDAILNWFIKPLLLLAFILFITLGLYINMYIFSVLEKVALITGGAIPFVGFGIGGVLTLLAKQGKPAAKTVAIESAIMNCIAVIIAIRFSLPQPEADLASAAAMWTLFFTPVPFLLMFIFHKIKKKIMSYFQKKELEKEQHTTMLQSFAAITQNALQMGGINQENRALYTNKDMNESGCDRTMLISSTSSHGSDPSQSVVNNVACLELSTNVDNSQDDLQETFTPELQTTEA